MNRWYEIARDHAVEDGRRIKDYMLVFETEDKELKNKIEQFYRSLMPTENLFGRGD